MSAVFSGATASEFTSATSPGVTSDGMRSVMDTCCVPDASCPSHTPSESTSPLGQHCPSASVTPFSQHSPEEDTLATAAPSHTPQSLRLPLEQHIPNASIAGGVVDPGTGEQQSSASPTKMDSAGQQRPLPAVGPAQPGWFSHSTPLYPSVHSQCCGSAVAHTP
jgi:hypothetical protein